MATLPENIGLDTELEYVTQPSRTWLINRQTMRIQSQTDGLEAVRQAVDIMLNTRRYGWQIYDSNIGEELELLVGEEVDYIISAFPQMVEDALSIDERIIAVENFQYTQNGDSLAWTFDVRTVYGDFSEEVTT